MERAHKPALQDREGRLDRVGVDVAAHVLVKRVGHGFMRRELLANALVDLGLVCHQLRALGDVLLHDRAQRVRGHVGDVEGALLAGAVHKRNDLHLVIPAAGAGLVLADVSEGIDVDDGASEAEVRAHVETSYTALPSPVAVSRVDDVA